MRRRGTPGPEARREIRAALRERDGSAPRCHYCAWLLTDQDRTIEHIWPRAYGGPWEPWNLVYACAVCNGVMADRLVKCYCPLCSAALWRALALFGWLDQPGAPLPRHGSAEALVERLEHGASLVASHNWG